MKILFKSLVKDRKYGQKLNSYFAAEDSGYRVYRHVSTKQYYLIDTNNIFSSFIIENIEVFTKKYIEYSIKRLKQYDEALEAGDLTPWLNNYFCFIHATALNEAVQQTQIMTQYNWMAPFKFMDGEERIVH